MKSIFTWVLFVSLIFIFMFGVPALALVVWSGGTELQLIQMNLSDKLILALWMISSIPLSSIAWIKLAGLVSSREELKSINFRFIRMPGMNFLIDFFTRSKHQSSSLN